MNTLENDKKHIILTGVVAIGIFLRFFVMTLGNNFDFDSYCVVGEIVSHGGNVYAETARYNYGPVFSCIQGSLYFFAYICSGLTGGDLQLIFRCLIVSLLTLTDLGIFLLILKEKGIKVAAFFFINPISIIISGYHNQFDNIAVLLALLAINFIVKGESESSHKYDILGVVFLALSLMTKHILYAFPIWIIFSKELPFRKRILYAVLPVIIFIISFIPFWAEGKEGILQNVFLYRSYNNMPILVLSVVDDFIPGITQLAFPIFISAMIVCAVIFRNETMENKILLYLIALVCFSSAIANQYLAIPCAAILMLGGLNRIGLAYFGAIGLYLLLEGHGLHLMSFIETRDIPQLIEIPLSICSKPTVMYSIGVWLLFLFLVEYVKKNIYSKRKL